MTDTGPNHYEYLKWENDITSRFEGVSFDSEDDLKKSLEMYIGNKNIKTFEVKSLGGTGYKLYALVEGNKSPTFGDSVAYECAFCKKFVIGPPEYHEAENEGGYYANCKSCNVRIEDNSMFDVD